MKFLRKAYRLLDDTERRQAWMVLGFVVLVTAFETVSTLSVMPVLSVLANPGLIETNAALVYLNRLLGYSEPRQFLIFLALASFAMLVLSAVVRSVGQFLVIRFTQMRGYTIGRRLLDAYLRRPYAFYLTRHSGDMSQSLLSEITMLIVQIYQPLTSLIAQGILFAALVSLLVVVNPVVAAVGLLILGGSYGLIYLIVRRQLDRMAKQRIAANSQRFRLLSEALGGIKVVKLLGGEARYRNRFGEAARRLAHYQAMTQSLALVPRYAIEAIAFGSIILLALILMLQHRDDADGGMSHVLPLLGIYAFAGYRLLPAIQSIYAALTQLRFGAPVLDAIRADLEAAADLAALPGATPAPLPFRHAVELQDVTFRHENAAEPSLREVSLTIPAGSTLGIVGSTGAGKTTLVDVFLGLLRPQAGEIRVDGVGVTADNLRAWQANIGYVPQEIFLRDASVAENIAFGLDPREIDMDQVRECARLAQILDFVETDLPQGFSALVGERGVRLSGGQRQRIGIARALYRDPRILVFDEATSALDNVTERDVVEAINALTGTRTILIIAHRISTVRSCDRILVMDRGRVAGLGSYATLYESNAVFRDLVDAREVA
jgi:ABC-type multidrug transport system fused ATPase/permease subunit